MISALVLAAGSSRRMGRPKLLLELEGEPLVRRAVRTAEAAGVGEVVVVVGPRRAAMAAALAGTTARLVENPDHLTGMASSLRVGLQALSPAAEAVVVLLADQPFQRSEVIERLVQAFRVTGQPIVAPLFGGRRGNPVLFSRALFGELAAQQGDQGGREVVQADPGRVASVEFADSRAQADVDTWEEYLAARAVLGDR